jgi:hypothetical protein
MAKKKWIADAVGKNKGAFSRQAKRAKKSTAAYAAQVLKPGSRASATTKRRARLAQTLGRLRKRKR